VCVPERELELTELPECGAAAFLAQNEDGYNNTYWLSLADGSVWMRYGVVGKPIHHVKLINVSVPKLRGMLEVWCALKAAEPSVEDERPAYERLVEETVLRAVSTEPEAFADSENWWPRTFEEAARQPRSAARTSGPEPLRHRTQGSGSGRPESSPGPRPTCPDRPPRR
jgi:hypothetical protein